jgi:hypothetical protein
MFAPACTPTPPPTSGAPVAPKAVETVYVFGKDSAIGIGVFRALLDFCKRHAHLGITANLVLNPGLSADDDDDDDRWRHTDGEATVKQPRLTLCMSNAKLHMVTYLRMSSWREWTSAEKEQHTRQLGHLNLLVSFTEKDGQRRLQLSTIPQHPLDDEKQPS